MVDAVRSLAMGPKGQALAGHSTDHDIVLSLVWAAAICVVIGSLAAWRFARR
jgi:hypothetical protein